MEGEKKKNLIRPDFLIIPYELFLDESLQPLDRQLYGVIYWLERLKDGRCIASNKTLAEVVGVKDFGSVQNALTRLEAGGHIKRIYSDKERKHRTEIRCLVKFKKVSSNDDTVSLNDDTRVSSNDDQISKSPKKEEKQKNIIATQSVAVDGDGFSETDRKELIDLFKHVNPSYELLFKRPNQTAALKRLVEKFGRRKVEGMIKALPEINAQQYAPTITTPIELEYKLGALKSYFIKQKNKSSAGFTRIS